MEDVYNVSLKTLQLAETWFIVAFYRQDRRTRKGVRVQTRLSDKMDSLLTVRQHEFKRMWIEGHFDVF